MEDFKAKHPEILGSFALDNLGNRYYICVDTTGAKTFPERTQLLLAISEDIVFSGLFEYKNLLFTNEKGETVLYFPARVKAD